MEVNTLVPNKQTFNRAYILFDEQAIAKKWLDVLILTGTEHTSFVWVLNGKVYYAFKMFRIKHQFFNLCLKLKEVLECS